MISDLNKYLQEWDNASKTKRQSILEEFISSNIGKSATDLENFFYDGASLFLTRITSWLRLSYMTANNVQIQLKAIHIFVASSSGNKFVNELIEVGVVLTLLEILGLKQLTEVVKDEALQILIVIVKTGRKYKELVCESYGIRAIVECLARSRSISCQDSCKNVLLELSSGNPQYQNQLYKALISLLQSSSPEAQQISAQILQSLQPQIDQASLSIVDPVLLLLRSLHLEVQYEGFELIKLLMNYKNINVQLLTGLVNALKPSKVDLQEKPEILSGVFIWTCMLVGVTTVANAPNIPSISYSILAPLPVYLQQAASAKLIRMLVEGSQKIASQCLELECVQNLLHAMGTEKHADSQKQASLTLQFFIHHFEEVESKVRDAMGQTFFFEYMIPSNAADSGFFHEDFFGYTEKSNPVSFFYLEQCRIIFHQHDVYTL